MTSSLTGLSVNKDNGQSINAMIGIMAGTGGIIEVPAGHWPVYTPIRMASGVTIRGTPPVYDFYTDPFRPRPNQGTWLTWFGPSGVPMVSFDSVQGAGLDGIGLWGQGLSTTGVSMTSMSATGNLLPPTYDIDFRRLIIADVVTGMTWGNSGDSLDSQIARVLVDGFSIFNCSDAGMVFNTANAGSSSIIQRGVIRNCVNSGIRLSSFSNLDFHKIEAGGPVSMILFDVQGWGGPLGITGCQAEGPLAFLVCNANDDEHVIHLQRNVINCPVFLNKTCRILAEANNYSGDGATLTMNAPGARYMASADTVQRGGKVRVNFGSYCNVRQPYADLRPGTVPGDIVIGKTPYTEAHS